MLDGDDYFTDEQLAISKRQYEIRQLREQEVTSQFAHTLSYWWCSASIDYFNGYLDNLNKVTRQDIQNYIRKYIKNKPHCAGLLINSNMKSSLSPESFFKSE
jgi:zinc protease